MSIFLTARRSLGYKAKCYGHINAESSTASISQAPPVQATPVQAPRPTPSQSTIPDASQSSIVLDAEPEDETLEWTPSPPAELSPPPPQSRSSTPRSSTPAPRSAKSDLGMLLKETLDARHSKRSEVALKRRRAETELKREGMASKERIAQIQAGTQAKQVDAQAKQAEAQARQTKSFTRLMEKMVGVMVAKSAAGDRKSVV